MNLTCFQLFNSYDKILKLIFAKLHEFIKCLVQLCVAESKAHLHDLILLANLKSLQNQRRKLLYDIFLTQIREHFLLGVVLLKIQQINYLQHAIADALERTRLRTSYDDNYNSLRVLHVKSITNESNAKILTRITRSFSSYET